MNNICAIIFFVSVNESIGNDGIENDDQDDFHLHSYGISDSIHLHCHFKSV